MSRNDTASLSWVGIIQALTRSDISSEVMQKRTALSQAVFDTPSSSEAWWGFLSEVDKDSPLQAPPLSVSLSSLRSLYQRATELVQRAKGQDPSEAYVNIWLGYAKHQWSVNEDDARDTFKTLRNQRITTGAASLYHLWASLEVGSGESGTRRALSVLAKGIKEKAQPVR